MNPLKYILLVVCFILFGNTAFSQEKKTENPDKIKSKESKNKKVQKQDGLETQSLPTKSSIPMSIKKKKQGKEKMTSNILKSHQTKDGDEVFYLNDENVKNLKVKSKKETNTTNILVIRDSEKLEQLKKGKAVKIKE
ncbi:hypothetical protein [Aquimarina muelleri]|nr:hypothetical protein [Aquimarina muelleri]MCX2764448.1 hypothetical protein [Aquimarina muelleri]